MCNPLQLEECHEGHESIAYASQGCPLCAALDKINDVEKELNRVEESLIYYVKSEQKLEEQLHETSQVETIIS